MKIRYLIIQFNRPLMAWELPYFRASVVEQTQRRSDLFHNHRPDSSNIYRYPLIQYKIIDKKPSIVCINAGTDDIHYLLEHQEFHFDIKGRVEKYEIEQMIMRNHRIQTWQSDFNYHIQHYLALNQENYELYKKLGGEKRKFNLIEELLHKHIQVLLDEIGINTDSIPLRSSITQLQSDKWIEHKGVHRLAFTLNFSCNVSLPNYIGIGKGVSMGFGSVKAINTNRKKHDQRKTTNSTRSTTA